MRAAPGSIRWRLMAAGAAAIAGALLIAAFGLTFLFDRHVQRVAVADLAARALSVVAMVEPDTPGGPSFRQAPGDPLYEQPFSGHYWQAELAGERRRSRSLWDYTLPLPAIDLTPGQSRVQTLPGPMGEPLLAFEQHFQVGDVPLRVVVATNRGELERARAGFLSDLLPYLALLGGLLLAGSVAQVIIGLKPLSQVSARVAALRSGAQPRMGQDMPQEVQPLAAEIDQLLDDRDAELARARHRASDLAHGFKTPLQALLGDAQQLRDRGAADLAESVETVATAMRRLVDRELARA
ncbi:MAG: HAMP domain-containing histidine kinase, partial [Gemmobacter sp.]|nr:HAMP domain-containing histidine kinase [Gemmobacter sp.]